MKLSVIGTLKQRTRIKILWFWIVTGWKTTQINEQITFNANGSVSKRINIAGIQLQLTGHIDGGDVTVDVSAEGFPIFSYSAPLPSFARHVHAEPIKGVIFDVDITLSPS